MFEYTVMKIADHFPKCQFSLCRYLMKHWYGVWIVLLCKSLFDLKSVNFCYITQHEQKLGYVLINNYIPLVSTSHRSKGWLSAITPSLRALEGKSWLTSSNEVHA